MTVAHVSVVQNCTVAAHFGAVLHYPSSIGFGVF